MFIEVNKLLHCTCNSKKYNNAAKKDFKNLYDIVLSTTIHTHLIQISVILIDVLPYFQHI